jgi:hypothetical protein
MGFNLDLRRQSTSFADSGGGKEVVPSGGENSSQGQKQCRSLSIQTWGMREGQNDSRLG